MRDPTENDIPVTQFWLNNETKQLFQFNGKWIALTQPERSKREDDIMYLKCFCGEYIHINDFNRRYRCGALNTMETS